MAYLEACYKQFDPLAPIYVRMCTLPFTRRTANNWLDKLVQAAEQDRGEAFPIDISTHTFRHSFAVNAILHGTDVAVLQSWLGHRDRQSTEIYTKILSSETAFLMRRIAFS